MWSIGLNEGSQDEENERIQLNYSIQLTEQQHLMCKVIKVGVG